MAPRCTNHFAEHRASRHTGSARVLPRHDTGKLIFMPNSAKFSDGGVESRSMEVQPMNAAQIQSRSDVERKAVSLVRHRLRKCEMCASGSR